MKIAFLHQPNDPYTEVRINYFLRQGHEVYSIVFNNKVKQKYIEGLHIIELPFIFINKFLKRFVYFYFIRTFTKVNQIDIFYIISALNSFYLKSSKAKKNILELQGSDVIITTKKFPFIKIFYRYYWKYANAITQDSIIAKTSAAPLFPPQVLNETINIGVDFDIFNDKIQKGKVRNKYKLKEAPIILHTRSLKKIYNIEILIKSLVYARNEIPDICYMITGEKGMLSTKLQNFINFNNLDNNLIFTGRLDHNKEIKYYYADADVCVSIPSSDSSPFSVYEAQATKTPVIVSDLPWVAENFDKNKHLYVLPQNDSLLLAELIIKIIHRTVKIDTEAAYEIVYENINMLGENNKLLQLFNNLLP